MGLYDFWIGDCPVCNALLPEDNQQKITGGAFRGIGPGDRFKYDHCDYPITHSEWVQQERRHGDLPQESGGIVAHWNIKCEECGADLAPILHIDDDDILTLKRYARICNGLHEDEFKLPLMRINGDVDLCDGEVPLGDAGVIDGSVLELVMAPMLGSLNFGLMSREGPAPQHGWRGPFSPARDGPLHVTIKHCGREREIGVAIDTVVGSLAAKAALIFQADSVARVELAFEFLDGEQVQVCYSLMDGIVPIVVNCMRQPTGAVSCTTSSGEELGPYDCPDDQDVRWLHAAVSVSRQLGEPRGRLQLCSASDVLQDEELLVNLAGQHGQRPSGYCPPGNSAFSKITVSLGRSISTLKRKIADDLGIAKEQLQIEHEGCMVDEWYRKSFGSGPYFFDKVILDRESPLLQRARARASTTGCGGSTSRGPATKKVTKTLHTRAM